MAERILVDNDVLIKMSAYDLARETLAAATLEGVPPAMLGIGKFVVRHRLSRGRWIANRIRAEAAFATLLAGMTLIEPREAELLAAADLESVASHLNLELDSGESQLLAVMILRACRLLLTGDKRAIRAIAKVAATETKNRIASLEQLIADVLRRTDASKVREQICREPDADKALAICFGCNHSSFVPGAEDVIAGLASYVKHLRSEAPDVLVSSNDLAALAA